ncbi:hypothetical protein RZA67_16320 [Stenotrophomonas sp. C3(2023)]|uniref:hypothetical protein n=1 Tax=Stenotrophomonas sp. C3(2023) TaxID=3080277 RepID=UPI00293C4B80|nr:hypothetical protein [Stenotrophomonas sp. C3(2023)]MDV3470281.1 hypothetical protein [Stenotrophomonas sp. C3(2023)]
MNIALSYTLSVFLCIVLTACEGRDNPLNPINPTPTLAYRIRLQIKDAPGHFESIRIGGQFDVRNADQCGRIRRATGTTGRISRSLDLPLARISDSEYEAVLHLDKMLDGDHFGRGDCHWQLSVAYAEILPQDHEKDASFEISMDAQDVVTGGSVTRYYPSALYREPKGFAGARMVGSDRPDNYLPGVRDHLFSLTLSSVGESE